MELNGINKALNEGCTIHGFLSGGGLRVVRIEKEKNLRGYGERPHVDDALCYADEDFLAGGRPYNQVYGKKHPHYLTGSGEITSQLDLWLKQGHTFDAHKENNKLVFVLKGLKQVKVPEHVVKKLKSNASVKWRKRGFIYETSGTPDGCYSRTIKTSGSRSPFSDWMYSITKSGVGADFSESMENAFKANEIEVLGLV